jgi:hypothetical protein
MYGVWACSVEKEKKKGGAKGGGRGEEVEKKGKGWISVRVLFLFERSIRKRGGCQHSHRTK